MTRSGRRRGDPELPASLRPDPGPAADVERYGLLLEAQRAAFQAGDHDTLARLSEHADRTVERLLAAPLSPAQLVEAAALANAASQLARSITAAAAEASAELAAVEAQLARVRQAQGTRAAPEPLLVDRTG